MMTKIMGILNVTPDSFYDGGRYVDLEAALQRALEAFDEGADILDIGGESTRPGAKQVSEEEELRRVIPIVKKIRERTSRPLSIDTRRPSVAEAALKAGVQMLNDVEGFRNPAMRRLAAEADVEICVMHMHENPMTMQDHPFYPEGIVAHLLHFFDKQINLLIEAGVRPEKIILDPGIGFGKTVADNLLIIQNLPLIKETIAPKNFAVSQRSNAFRLLLGVSRKSFLQRLLKRPAVEMLTGTLVVNSLAAKAGVDIVRVHDVRAHRDMITVLEALQAC